jgi:phosphoribosylamine---glycine ligase
VLGVTATANNLNVALQKAYEAVEKIQFEGMHYRKDIGKPQQQSTAVGD